MDDENIDYSDNPEWTDEELKNATHLKAGEFDAWAKKQFLEHRKKHPITMRIDKDIVEFYKSFGKNYQTKINAILRKHMEINSHNHKSQY
jgi:uncharacterized protein (DUF4415 family)